MATLAAIHCGVIPVAILEVGDLKDELDYDYVVGGSALQAPDPVPDLGLPGDRRNVGLEGRSG